MKHARIAYMPLATYPEAVGDEAILAAAGFAASLGCRLHVTVFSVDIPRISSPLGSFLVNLPGLAHAAKEKSKAECQRLLGLVQKAGEAPFDVHCKQREVVIGGAFNVSAAEARYYDLAVLPWSGETMAAQDMAQCVVFGSGRPVILVPPSARPAALDHIAIAWDGSRVAARALGDTLPLLREGGRVSVLTVEDEKPLSGPDIAGALALSLGRRDITAAPIETTLGSRSIAEALQAMALSQGAQLLAMGGFGHSRLRDFVLGGATQGVLAHLQLPILLSH